MKCRFFSFSYFLFVCFPVMFVFVLLFCLLHQTGKRCSRHLKWVSSGFAKLLWRSLVLFICYLLHSPFCLEGTLGAHCSGCYFSLPKLPAEIKSPKQTDLVPKGMKLIKNQLSLQKEVLSFSFFLPCGLSEGRTELKLHLWSWFSVFNIFFLKLSSSIECYASAFTSQQWLRSALINV